MQTGPKWRRIQATFTGATEHCKFDLRAGVISQESVSVLRSGLLSTVSFHTDLNAGSQEMPSQSIKAAPWFSIGASLLPHLTTDLRAKACDMRYIRRRRAASSKTVDLQEQLMKLALQKIKNLEISEA